MAWEYVAPRLALIAGGWALAIWIVRKGPSLWQNPKI